MEKEKLTNIKARNLKEEVYNYKTEQSKNHNKNVSTSRNINLQLALKTIKTSV